MSDEHTRHRPSSAAQIGVDEWVAQADERTSAPRRARAAGSRASGSDPAAGRQARAARRRRSSSPFLPFISEGNLFHYGVFILIYALLALGLNVVVGFAGLLDLGYVAFFGFGAYIYALPRPAALDKGHIYTHHWDAQWSILMACSSARVLGLLLGLVVAAAARRLPRDRDALLRPGLRRLHERRPTRTGSRAARTGSPTSTRSTFFGGHDDRHDPRLLLVPARLSSIVVLVVLLLHQRVADRARVEGARARIRSPRR